MNYQPASSTQMLQALATYLERSVALPERGNSIMSWLTMNLPVDNNASNELIMTRQQLIDIGLLNADSTMPAISIFDDVISQSLHSSLLKISYRMDSYSIEAPHTIMACLNVEKVTDAVVAPFLYTIQAAGCATLMQYAKRLWAQENNSVVTYAVVTLEYKGDVYDLLSLEKIDNDNYKVTLLVTGESTQFINKIFPILTIFGVTACRMNGVANLARLLSNAPESVSDVMESMRFYLDHSNVQISGFFRSLLLNGRANITAMINKLLSTYRSANSYVVEEDGSITWTAEFSPISLSTWSCIGSAVLTATQVIGTILLVTGGALLRVVGALVTVGTSVISTAVTTIGQLTGTTPVVQVDAGDENFSVPIFQGSNVPLPPGVDKESDLYQYLANGSNFKIVTPFYILYLYNYKNDTNKVDYKVFLRAAVVPKNLGTKVMHPVGELYSTVEWLYNYGFRAAVSTSGETPQLTSCYDAPAYSGWNDDFSEYKITQATRRLIGDDVDQLQLFANSADSDDWVYLWTVITRAFSATIASLRTPFTKLAAYSVNLVSNRWLAIYMLYYMFRDDASNVSSSEFVNQMIYLSRADFGPWALWPLLYNNGYITGGDQASVCKRLAHDLAGSPLIRWDSDKSIIQNWSSDDTEQLYVCSDAEIDSAFESPTNCWGVVSTYNPYYTNSLAFEVPSVYSYITPQGVDFKTALSAAVTGTVVTVGAIFGFMATRFMLQRTLKAWYTMKGQQLLEDGKVFRQNWTAEEWAELSSADRAEWNAAWRKYNFKVKLYNLGAEMLGLSTLDWINNWYDSPSGIINQVPINGGASTSEFRELLAYGQSVVGIKSSGAADSSLTYTEVVSGEKQISLVDIYNAITGFSRV